MERHCTSTGGSGACADLAGGLYDKLNTRNYTRGVSILHLPPTYEEWRAEHRTARKRADRCARLGYRFDTIDRSEHNDAIHEINTSKQERQGRPMSAGYMRRHNHGALPEYPCARHRIHTYGVLDEGDTLRAYLSLYRVGDLALVSMILGHGAHLRNDVMYLLAAGMIEEQIPLGGFGYYNRHDSGTAGLVYYKERLGFRQEDVEWVL